MKVPIGIAVEHHPDPIPALFEMACGDERIAAVVAGTGEHQHRCALIAHQLTRELGGRKPCALHQRLRRGRREIVRFNGTNLAREIEGSGLVSFSRHVSLVCEFNVRARALV